MKKNIELQLEEQTIEVHNNLSKELDISSTELIKPTIPLIANQDWVADNPSMVYSNTLESKAACSIPEAIK